MATYRDLTTGEEVPAHLIGTTEDGRHLYRSVEGYEPTFNYRPDEDGNWLFYRDSEIYEEVYRFSHDAWQIHRKNETIVTSDDYHSDHCELCLAVGIDSDDNGFEDWSCEITELDEQHTALQVGDAVVCAGYGSDVIVLR